MLSLESSSKAVLDDFKKQPRKAQVGGMRGLTFAGKMLRKETQKQIRDRSQKSGKLYKYKSRYIRASAPGEYPANRSGNLARSIGFDVNGFNLYFGARNPAFYAKFLDKGTRKMRPRPFLDRTVQKEKLEVLKIVGREIERELQK